MNSNCKLFHLLLPCLLTLAMPLLASEWDAGGGANSNWSESSNWNTNSSPAGTDVLFESAGLTGGSTPTNIVDEDMSIQSLIYHYDSTSQSQVTEILDGVTLTVGGTSLDYVFEVGGFAQNSVTTTSTIIKGAGSLVIDQVGGTISIASHYLGDSATLRSVTNLDMTGLSSFQANLGASGALNIGASLPTNVLGAHQRTESVVRLANTNSITAGALRISSIIPASQISISNPGTYSSILYLGAENVLNVDTIEVGVGSTSRASGEIHFDSSVLGDSPTAIIRASDGVSAVTSFSIGVNKGGGTSNQQLGIVDFSGGSVDALIKDLVIGNGNNSGSGDNYAQGTLTMDEGIIKVDTAIVGQSRGINTTSTNSGIININGGEFVATNLTLAQRTTSEQKASGTLNITNSGSVTVTKGIVMGNRTGGTGTDDLTAIINIDGGSLTVGGNIAEGTVPSASKSTINLRGGLLEMNGHAIAVDTFNAESGVLQNLGEFNSGADLVKSGSGELKIDGENTYTGGTDVQAGTLTLSGSVANGNIHVANGATFDLLNSGSITFNITGISSSDLFTLDGGTASFGGNLVFNFDADYGTSSWLLFDGTQASDFTGLTGISLAGAFSGNLTDSGNNFWEGSVNGKLASFDASSGIFQIIPEPGSVSLLLLGLIALVARRKR